MAAPIRKPGSKPLLGSSPYAPLREAGSTVSSLAFYLGIGLALTTVLFKRIDHRVKWFIARAEHATVDRKHPVDGVGGPRNAGGVLSAVGSAGQLDFSCDRRPVGLQTLTASRRTLLLLSVTPVWIVTAIVCLWIWSSLQNQGHLTVLGLLGLILADACLLRFGRFPLPVPGLPGKSHVNMALAVALLLMSVGSNIVAFERNALGSTGATNR